MFLSYDRADAAKAKGVAQALESAGHSVWWDRHIKGGAQYSTEIEEALDRAQAVVVLWSAQAVQSAWVRDEAAAGRDSGRLVPATLDKTPPPLGFRQYQTVDLSRRTASGKSAALKQMLTAIEALGGGSGAPTASPTPPLKRRTPLPRLVAAGLIAALLLGGGFVGWEMIGSGNGIPTIGITAADNSPSTNSLARELTVLLGSLQPVTGDRQQLVEHDAAAASKADLIFEVGEGKNRQRPEASLVLLDGTDRAILWSKTFQPSSGNPTDLRQQLAFTAARVMNCAVEARNNKGKHLDQQTTKVYLAGCAQHAELSDANLVEIIPLFVQVSEKAPWFEPGWAKLLDAETNAISNEAVAAPASPELALLRKHIDQARKLDPTLPEIALAELRLLPANALLSQAKLIDRGLADQPDNAQLLASRSRLLGSVGRWQEAVRDARRASQLEPLSPASQLALIVALADSGWTEAAFGELEKAERLWPGASNIIDARFWLNFRYGDPSVALKLMRSGVIDIPLGVERVLVAKTDPTPDNVARAKETIRLGLQQSPQLASGPVQGYALFGMEQELYDNTDQWLRPDPALYSVLFRHGFRTFRKDPRFMKLAKRVGLINYWRATSRWPDFCSDSELPYDCEVEAAKLG